jgi:two-component system, response regulator PdtaR
MTSLDRQAVTTPDSQAAKQAWAPDDRRGRREGRGGRQVLIVEDEYFLALDLETTLQRAGFEVVGVASTAEQAVRMAEARRPSVVVMDVRLAGDRDGIDAAIEIFERFAIRCVFATAHHDPHTVARAARANAAGWLAKPYAPESVIAAVRAAVKLPPVQ